MRWRITTVPSPCGQIMPMPLANRGNTLGKLRRHGDALTSYARALELQPVHVEALVNRGGALLDLRQYDAALRSYDRALALRPDYAEVLVNRGVTLHELKQSTEALK